MGSAFGNSKNSMSGRNLEPVDLLCEYAHNPIGIDTSKPRFSWKAASDERGQCQSAYRILVASDPSRLDAEEGDIWDSGKVVSAQSTNVPFDGRTLTSRGIYFWKVCIWDGHGKESPYSECSHFEMGLLQTEDWKADWIGSPVFGTESPLFRKEFTIRKKVVKARIYLSGLGYCELHINGKKAGDHVLDPAWTDYRKRVLYATYAVEEFLEPDSTNAIGIMLGAGWYGKAHLNNVHASTQLLFQMEIGFEDGSVDIITSKIRSGWMVNSSGPVTFSSVFDGEHYDARLEKEGWDTADYGKKCTGKEHAGKESAEIESTEKERAEWQNPLWMEPPGGEMVSQSMEAIKVVGDLIPISMACLGPGIRVYDLGQNIAGWVKLKIRGSRGDKVTIRYAELVYEDGTVNRENLRTAESTDTYILKGGGTEVFEPRFTYHGFRYVQVEGLPEDAGMDAVTGRVVRSAVEQVGSFHCSDPLLNKIQEIVVRSEANNLYGLPTDCPQRDERLAWLNDMTVRAEEAVFNFNLPRLYSKWENDIADTQGETTGAIADTAPFHRYGRRPADPVCSSYLIVPWLMYLHYGDLRILEQHYEGFKRWMDYLGIHAENHIIHYSSYGDWASPATQSEQGSIGAGAVSASTPGSLMSTGYYFFNATLLAKIAGILGKSDDAKLFGALSCQIKNAFNDAYLNRETSQYAAGSQASNTFALYLGLVPRENQKAVLENLVKDIMQTNSGHLTTGNLCTKYIMEVLCEAGRMDVAWLLATRTTYPSWGYMIAQGATTVWERWEHVTTGAGCEMASHDHPMYGSIGAWFYKYLGGIHVDPEGPGFGKIEIRPFIAEGLEVVDCSLETVKGLVKSGWRKEQNALCLDISIPFNTEAWIHVPGMIGKRKTLKIAEGQTLLWGNGRFSGQCEGVLECAESDAGIAFRVGSGTYRFRAEGGLMS